MFLIKSLCFFAFLQTVISDLSSMEPCLATDIDCLSKTTQTFLDNTSGGIPQFDIRTLDPITIPHLDVTPEGVGVTFHLKNIVVQGFKDQKISSFKLDKDSKAVSLKTKVNVTFNSDITVELHKLSKSYSGKLDAQAYAEGHAQYTYVFKTDDKGVEHYEVGPETNSCELLGDPKFTLSPDLVSALEADAEYQAEKAKHSGIVSKTRETIICEVVKTVYVTAIHNIRASARILPKSAFFKDV